ncbi:MAG: hypothetical protein ACREUL_01895 [Steroidobacteraceae bacterium]
MKARGAKPGARIFAIAENLYPGYFALVMATGALSIAFHLHGYETPARTLLAFNVAAYAALAALLVLRLVRFPRRVAAGMTEHARAPGFFTVVAGTCVLGTNLAVTGGFAGAAMILWEIGIALGVVVMYSFFFAVVTRPEKPNLENGINGAWLIAAVASYLTCCVSFCVADSRSERPIAKRRRNEARRRSRRRPPVTRRLSDIYPAHDERWRSVSKPLQADQLLALMDERLRP